VQVPVGKKADCCQEKSTGGKGACCKEMPAAKKDACCEEQAGAPFSKNSLYQADVAFTDDAGRAIKLGSLRGRPVVLTMFFASCGYACPLLVSDIEAIRAKVPAELRDRAALVLVSFDIVRDTPAALAAFRTQRGLDAQWTLLHGSADSVRELAALLGVKYQQTADGMFSHSNLITILNAQGEVVHQRTGLKGGLDEAADALTTARAATDCAPLDPRQGAARGDGVGWGKPPTAVKLIPLSLAVCLLSVSSLSAAPEGVRLSLNARLRYEDVHQSGLRDGTAFTLRTRLGLSPEPFHGWTALLEAENIVAFDGDRYSQAGLNPGGAGRAVVSDPTGTEINQAWVAFTRGQTTATLGRQRLVLDNARFVG
jgi:protein SCO1/2